MKGKIILLVVMLAITTVGQAQTRREKSDFIIQKLDLVKIQKKHYDDKIEFMLYVVDGKDTIRIHEIEKIVTEQFVKDELLGVFDTLFNDQEIEELYVFCHSTSLEKLFFPKWIRSMYYIKSPTENELETIYNRHVVYEK